MIIGLVGRAGSGKDTVAGMLTEILGGAASLSFAEPLKRFCGEVFDFSLQQLYGPSEARNAPDLRYPRAGRAPLSPREALQTLGTEWGRACYPDIWAELGIRRARAAEHLAGSVVFTDTRFVNEAARIRAAGGEVWRVRRPSADSVITAHASETEMNSREMEELVTLTLHNNGSLEELRKQVQIRAHERRLK